MHHLSIKQMLEGLKQKQFSALELTEHYINRIKQQDHLNALNQVYEQSAIEEAKSADKAIQANKASPLTGIPLIHKDIFCSKEGRTTCSSKMLAIPGIMRFEQYPAKDSTRVPPHVIIRYPHIHYTRRRIIMTGQNSVTPPPVNFNFKLVAFWTGILFYF